MFKVKVPATSANIGPGFDTLGMALSINNVITFKENKSGVIFEDVEDEYSNENNLIYQSMLKTWEYLNEPKKGVVISVEENIPISRGLGSSAACIIGGILGALTMSERTLSNEEILKIAMSLEGHPDNITPALIGSVTIATTVEDDIEYMKLDIKDQYDFYLFIPPVGISTEESRKVLPETISMKDAVYNVSRAAMLVATLLSGKQEFLTLALGDKLHQQFRSKLIDGYDELIEYMGTLNFLGNFISGAGPAVVGVAERGRYMGELQFKDWRIEKLNIDNEGAKIIR
ncbi:MAG: homoserine kinase [Clostridiales bacterium]|nr:homoserine kinase [Clostridiales bacterium]